MQLSFTKIRVFIERQVSLEDDHVKHEINIAQEIRAIKTQKHMLKWEIWKSIKKRMHIMVEMYNQKNVYRI